MTIKFCERANVIVEIFLSLRRLLVEHREGGIAQICRKLRATFALNQKNPRAHKNKIGTPPPPNPKSPPLKWGILWTQVFLQKERIFQAPIKLAQPFFPGPELRTRILRTRGFFWLNGVYSVSYMRGTVLDFVANSRINFRHFYANTLRELVSYILRYTLQPWQLKAPGPRPTIKQLKEACKGNRSPCKGEPMALQRGTEPPRKGDRGPF